MPRLSHRTHAGLVGHARRQDAPVPPVGSLFASEQEFISSRIVTKPSGCWVWKDQPNRYAKMGFRLREVLVHRLMLELFRGEPIPPGDHVHHKCEVKGCVNPAHLVVLHPGQHMALHHSGVGRRS
jgi:hypothetical protein